ncbi:MAG: hydrogenase iron-sulfur subunit [Desulfatitalea sp.]|nr:hydrogenase iron-sulfur subunit [Desulfatitalea sp.]NNK01533.1 hydrogenase iron-sulfur subunit [Desulfatitalea sp.]
MSSKGKFEPKMLGMICNWCCYGGADLCGVSRFQYPAYIKLIRVMCSGRVDLKHIFLAFANGADAMFVGGCHINDCHYNPEGNYDALSMVSLCKKLLAYIGINPKRLRLEWVSAGEGIRFAAIMNEFAKEIEQLGPLGKSEGIKENELQARLEKVTKLIPYIKLKKKEKLALHDPALADHQSYKDLFSGEEIETLILKAPSYWIDPEKCQGCMSCAARCPVDAIVSAKLQVHVVDQGKCIKCGTCLTACSSKFGAVTKITGAPVPPPTPEDRIQVARKNNKKAA